MSAHLAVWINQIVHLSVWLVLLSAVFVPLEWIFSARPQRVLRRGVWTDLAYYFINSLVVTSALSVPLAALAWAVHRVMPEDFLSTMADIPVWAAVPLAMVVGDVGYYWAHVVSHRVPWLWRFHAVHHSAEEMDFLVNTRDHPLDMAFSHFCQLMPIYVLGLGNPSDAQGSLVPLLAIVLGTFWGFFIHANVRWRLGPLEWLVTTPAFHHWHHTRSGPIDRNFAAMFPWLDRLFGTSHLPPQLPVDYGIAEPMPATLVGQLLYPFRAPARADAPSSGAVTR